MEGTNARPGPRMNFKTVAATVTCGTCITNGARKRLNKYTIINFF